MDWLAVWASVLSTCVIVYAVDLEDCVAMSVSTYGMAVIGNNSASFCVMV